MIKKLGFVLFLSICYLQMNAQNKTRKAVFVIVDGVSADVIKKLKLPAFSAIAKEGGFQSTKVGGDKGTYSETPTISAVGYNSVMTGTWVHKHNVWDNDIKEPNYHYPTIFRVLKSSRPEKTIGIFSSWTDNRTKLIGENLPQTQNIIMDFVADGYELDTFQFPQDQQRDFMHRIDEKVVAEASQTLREKGPDLSWVYLEYTDDMGHMYGDSPRFYEAVGYADQQVGKLWKAIQYRQQNFNEEWLIVVTTDHGRDSVTGKDHGGQSAREKAGWILTNAKGLNKRFTSGRSGMVDIMPTILKFMNITPDESVAREIDGLPIIGKISFSDLKAEIKDNKIELKWRPEDGTGQAKIFVSTTNNFKNGGNDEYQYLKTVAIKDGQTILEPGAGSFYKILMEGPFNRMNVWLMVK